MKILLISYSWLPHVSPRSLRWSAVTRCWAEEGHDVDVVCGAQGEDPGTFDQQSVCVHRIGSSFFRRRGVGKGLRGKEKTVAGAVSRPSLVKRVLKWIYTHSWRLLYWPDYTCLWIWPARYRVNQLLQQKQYDAVITVSLPFSGHLTVPRGFRKQRSFIWLVDCGDPFAVTDACNFNNRWLFESLNLRAEQSVFSQADYVSVTTPGTAEIYAGIFPGIVTPIHVIPPLVDLDRVSSGNAVVVGDNIIRLVYVGNFYVGVREPGPLLSLFEQLINAGRLQDRLELHIYGSIHGFEATFSNFPEIFSPCLFLHGPVSHAECSRAIDMAACLVNLGNETRYQLPSKVVEYAATGLPVLNIALVSSDSSARFFENYPMFFNYHIAGKGNNIAAVEEFLLDYAGERAPENVTEAIRDRYSAKTIAAAYLALLQA